MSEMNRAVELNKRVESVMGAEGWLDAIKLLKTELPVVRKDWRLSWNLGWCFFKLERIEDARKYLLQATKLAPESASFKWALGSVCLHQKQYQQAEINLAHSLRIKDAYVTRISLALAYLKQGKITEAENVHLEGIRLKPEEGRRYKAYADFLSDVGREHEAQRTYRKAKKLNCKAE
jgi:Tfp pilus assembly protein PilF